MNNYQQKLSYYFQEMRPHQWIKNFLIFAPVIFVGQFLNFTFLGRVIWTFIAFCSMASSTYILNDIFDLKKDEGHSKKRQRPLASRKISLTEAKFLSLLLLIFNLSLAIQLGWQIFIILAFYFCFNLFYSLILKHIVILDIMAVATMYLIRVYAGAAVINVPVSDWLLLTTLFIALFIATAKRRAEIVINQSNNDSITRQVLVDYNNQFLEHLLIISNIATLVFYALYTMTHGGLFIWSIFFVIYAMFRYLWLVLIKNIGEEPEKIIITDKPILFSIFGWAIFVILVLYL